ncbi:PREDICTED: betaine--homocysteine S-methyltransferase 1-like [Acropora digitifera]|uniref:betaine--homocysteine S-methyltransferase 1-like n=1 Tax=Acropora digitifera TaxID=70779 RepID=UPI00077A8FD0|nr:PREDICTED: betaine--homocysteine S-methyltransferase 1-like [Acropora digitifera]
MLPGADIIGVNCISGPFECLEAIKLLKKGLEEAAIKRHLMIQPLGFHIPDGLPCGYFQTADFPFALEPRTVTRWDIHKFARKAYDLGVRFIGGCCGFEAYHIRAIAEELRDERGGKLPPASEKHGLWGSALKQHTLPWLRARARREYWENHVPATGRPNSCAFSSQQPHYDLIPGHEDFRQQKEMTTEEVVKQLATRK